MLYLLHLLTSVITNLHKYMCTSMFMIILFDVMVNVESIAPSFSGLSTSMFVNSYESDFIYLRYSPHTTFPGATHPGGVFATNDFMPDNIICQPRGHLVPMENISKVNISSILTYHLSTPPVKDGVVGEKKRYVLIDNTICSRIRFCFPTAIGQEGLGSCGNAVLSGWVGSGMLVVKAIKNIAYDTEIIMELHHSYIIFKDGFQEMCQFDPHGCGISIERPSTPKQWGIIPSEDFVLYLAPSTIPGAGMGVFTKFDIPPYHIIVMCQGKVYEIDQHLDADRRDRLTAPLQTRHGNITIQMDNYCGYTNDIINISFLDKPDYMPHEMLHKGTIPIHGGLQYNSEQGAATGNFPAIISLVHIPAHSEIFQPYGESYWWFRYLQKHKTNTVMT